MASSDEDGSLRGVLRRSYALSALKRNELEQAETEKRLKILKEKGANKAQPSLLDGVQFGEVLELAEGLSGKQVEAYALLAQAFDRLRGLPPKDARKELAAIVRVMIPPGDANSVAEMERSIIKALKVGVQLGRSAVAGPATATASEEEMKVVLWEPPTVEAGASAVFFAGIYGKIKPELLEVASLSKGVCVSARTSDLGFNKAERPWKGAPLYEVRFNVTAEDSVMPGLHTAVMKLVDEHGETSQGPIHIQVNSRKAEPGPAAPLAGSRG